MKVDVELIDVLGGVRDEPDDQALEALAKSMRAHQMLAPLIVVPRDDAPGRFRLIAGRRRLAAARRNNWTHIKCVVRKSEPINDEMMELTENFHRLELSPHERDRAVVRYATLLRALAEKAIVSNGRFPPLVEPATEEGLRQRELLQRRAEEGRARATAARIAGRQGQTERGKNRKYKIREPEVVKAVADQFGVSPRMAQRILRRADVLSAEEIEQLLQAGCNNSQIDRIVEIDDPEKRSYALKLVAQGMVYSEAMHQALGEDYRDDDRDLGDAEFLASLPLATQAVNQPRFRSDAIFYRRVAKLKNFFITSLHWEELKDEMIESGGVDGLYFRRLKAFLDCPHPRHWIKCPGCHAGTSMGKDHSACRGTGYLLG